VLARDHAAMGSFLIPCPNCHCHAKSVELTCPSCGEPLRRSDGSVPRTAVAVLLGLTAAGALMGACGNTVAAFYGVAVTSGAGGAGGGTGGDMSSSSSSAVFYGPAMTSSSGGGAEDDGGTDSGDGENDGGTDSGDGG
jgi:hypothetical protein